MTTRTWSFYREDDGSFTGREYSALDERFLLQNTPPGCASKEGRYDFLTQSVDISTGEVVNVQTERWKKRIGAEKSDGERQRSLAAIEALERKQQRPMRELQIDPGNADAARRLEEIEAEIVVLRSELTR